MVVLDTCALIDICCQKNSITEKTIEKIEMGAFVLSVSFAEIECKLKLKKLEIDSDTLSLYNHFQKVPNIKIVDICVEDWLYGINLNWNTNNDPVDRLITAFALQRQHPIVTCDKKIKEYYKNCIW